MKIKEVCERTGLTERAVRYYESEGLLTPSTHEQNGRIFRNYSDGDVVELNNVAALRKLLFTVDEIKLMAREPGHIPDIVTNYKLRLQTAETKMANVLSVLDGLDLQGVSDMDTLVRAFSRASLPEGASRLSGTSPDQEDEKAALRRRARERAMAREMDLRDSGERLIKVIIAAELLSAAAVLLLSFSLQGLALLAADAVLCICLGLGRRWARVVVGVFHVLTCLSALSEFCRLMAALAPAWFIVLLLLIALWHALCAYWLLAGKAVRAYVEYEN